MGSIPDSVTCFCLKLLLKKLFCSWNEAWRLENEFFPCDLMEQGIMRFWCINTFIFCDVVRVHWYGERTRIGYIRKMIKSDRQPLPVEDFLKMFSTYELISSSQQHSRCFSYGEAVTRKGWKLALAQRACRCWSWTVVQVISFASLFSSCSQSRRDILFLFVCLWPEKASSLSFKKFI